MRLHSKPKPGTGPERDCGRRLWSTRRFRTMGSGRSPAAPIPAQLSDGAQVATLSTQPELPVTMTDLRKRVTGRG